LLGRNGMRYGIPRQEAEGTGLPLYFCREDVPLGFIAKTHCTKAKQPVRGDEKPVAYFLSRLNHGYIALYKRDGLNIKDF